MTKIEVKSLEDILKESLNKCQTTEEKFDKIIKMFADHTRLLDIILNSMPLDAQQEILMKSGFKEQMFN